MAGDCPPGKIYLSFKTKKNIKIADPIITINSFFDLDNILQKKKLRYHSESKIRRHLCPATIAG